MKHDYTDKYLAYIKRTIKRGDFEDEQLKKMPSFHCAKCDGLLHFSWARTGYTETNQLYGYFYLHCQACDLEFCYVPSESPTICTCCKAGQLNTGVVLAT